MSDNPFYDAVTATASLAAEEAAGVEVVEALLVARLCKAEEGSSCSFLSRGHSALGIVVVGRIDVSFPVCGRVARHHVARVGVLQHVGAAEEFAFGISQKVAVSGSAEVVVGSGEYLVVGFHVELREVLATLEGKAVERGAAETSLSQCNHICRYGTALIRFIVVPMVGASI